MGVIKMLNSTLYLREMKKSIPIIIILLAVITMYVTIIIGMYDPSMKETLNAFYEIMPELMSSFGMKAGSNTLLGFMVSYLYGFILIIFPLIFCIIRGNGLVSKYCDSGAMAILLASPVKRKSIVVTQLVVLLSGVLILDIYTTGLEFFIATINFPNELVFADLFKLNVALLFLHLFIAAICFFASCLFSESKYSLAVGAGIPIFMFVLQMLANVGEKTEGFKYATFFTLFNAEGIIASETGAFTSSFVLLVGAILLYIVGSIVFCKKDICV